MPAWYAPLVASAPARHAELVRSGAIAHASAAPLEVAHIGAWTVSSYLFRTYKIVSFIYSHYGALYTRISGHHVVRRAEYAHYAASVLELTRATAAPPAGFVERFDEILKSFSNW